MASISDLSGTGLFDPQKEVSTSIRLGEGERPTLRSMQASLKKLLGLTGRDRGSVLYFTGEALTIPCSEVRRRGRRTISMLGSRLTFCLDPTNDVSMSIRLGDGDLARSNLFSTSNTDIAASDLKIGLTGRDTGWDRGSVLYFTGEALTTS